MFASIVSSITSLLSGLNSHAKKFETTSDRLDEVMRTEEFPKALQVCTSGYICTVEYSACTTGGADRLPLCHRTVPLLVVAQLTELTVGAAPIR